jgi:hypothetical protein
VRAKAARKAVHNTSRGTQPSAYCSATSTARRLVSPSNGQMRLQQAAANSRRLRGLPRT